MSDDRETPAQRRARRARRVGLGVYVFAVTLLALICTVQITRQVFFPAKPPGVAPFTSCDGGVLALRQAIVDGRAAADRSPDAQGDRDPEAALNRFRAAVGPVWAHREAVEDLCGPERQALLDALVQLRYSEEHGVRHQAIELAGLRRRVRALIAQQLPSAARAPAAPTTERTGEDDVPLHEPPGPR